MVLSYRDNHNNDLLKHVTRVYYYVYEGVCVCVWYSIGLFVYNLNSTKTQDINKKFVRYLACNTGIGRRTSPLSKCSLRYPPLPE